MHQLITLTGRSGCGKSSLERLLCSTGIIPCTRVISHTTRKPREREINGVDYYFVTKEEIFKMRDNNELGELTEFNGNYYAASLKELETKDVFVVEPKGLTYLKNNDLCKNIKFISFYIQISRETSIDRMCLRGDDAKLIYDRIKNDDEVFEKYHNWFEGFKTGLYNSVIFADNKNLEELMIDLNEKVDKIISKG